MYGPSTVVLPPRGRMTPAWRTLIERSLAVHGHRVEAMFLQMATVKYNGRPANRTVYFRGFVKDSNKLMICSDTRSPKMAEIRQSPYAEGCWYFPSTWEQYRLEGKIEVVSQSTPNETDQQMRTDLWRSLSDKARGLFAGPPPGDVVQPDQPAIERTIDNDVPADCFCLLLLDPTAVDYLALQPEATRYRYEVQDDGNWTQTELYR